VHDSRSATSAESLRARLSEGAPLVLDGALGTELERRGATCTLPLWSAHALIERPELVRAIHDDYVAAGADVLTANTFRTQRRTLARGGAGARAAELTARAVTLACAAAEGAPAGRHVRVAGSIAPLEDCYHPERVPRDDALAEEHAEHARHLAAAGADLLLVETMNTVREAVAALRAARATGLPTWASFVCASGARLLSGEPLADALAAVRELDPQAVLVNCLPPREVVPCLAVLAAAGVPFGVYANLGAPDAAGGFVRSDDCAPAAFGTHAATWARAGARVVGGCCGTTPAHVRAAAEAIAR
jgi:S-methylmethionine-dependent homocysteine/selenocysteine methylase